MDNKISLYNKDGIGLNFAYENGHHEHLNKGDDAFYYSVFTKREQQMLYDADAEDLKPEEISPRALTEEDIVMEDREGLDGLEDPLGIHKRNSVD